MTKDELLLLKEILNNDKITEFIDKNKHEKARSIIDNKLDLINLHSIFSNILTLCEHCSLPVKENHLITRRGVFHQECKLVLGRQHHEH